MEPLGNDGISRKAFPSFPRHHPNPEKQGLKESLLGCNMADTKICNQAALQIFGVTKPCPVLVGGTDQLSWGLLTQILDSSQRKAEAYGTNSRMHQAQHLVAPVHPALSKKGHIGHGDVDHFWGRGTELLGPQLQRLPVCLRYPRVRCLCESGRYPGATKERRESL